MGHKGASGRVRWKSVRLRTALHRRCRKVRAARIKAASVLSVRHLVVFALALSLMGCQARSSTASAAPTPSASTSPAPTASVSPTAIATKFSLNAPILVVHVGLGVACSRNGVVGQPSYLVSDIGKPGVPTIDNRNLAMLHKIMQYVHSRTLRFSYLRGAAFSVYDATYGPCGGTPYTVLNAPRCDEVFMPTDVDTPRGNQLFAGPGGCYHQPRPWMPHGGGNPNGEQWSRYNKSPQ